MAANFFLQLSYQSSLSVSILMSMMNAPWQEMGSFISQYMGILGLSMALTAFLGLMPISADRRMTFVSVFIGFGYLFIPSLLQLPSVYRNELYIDYLNKGTSRGHSTLFSQVEYTLHKLSLRLPMLTSVIALSDSVTFLTMQVNTQSTWQQVERLPHAPTLLVIGIGESLRAANMSLYGYSRDTTPKLMAMRDQLHIIRHAYAAGTNTWNAIPAMLTHGQGLPDLSQSIIHLAKDAGYQTFWLSNQAALGQWDFSITSLAKQADHAYFTSDELGGSQYDGVLLPQLSAAITATDQPKLIILHFYGSHMNFTDRYPQAFAQFSSASQLVDQYDNSVLYTDTLQHQLIELVLQHEGKYMFFADHGLGDPHSSIPLKHDVRRPPALDSLHVPLFMTPDPLLSIAEDAPLSLYNFECLFAQWAGISALQLSQDDFCQQSLASNILLYFDANMELHTDQLPTSQTRLNQLPPSMVDVDEIDLGQ
ncbi:phosphoethanolamine transferase [Shewanella sp. NIFS-20-20]|uniref:phosphoethanolamine transferase n=1 Tax=Shewanella sp. NIFS-20-20 TaxID=2853806 RepID=UPI001C455C7B|nr:phosphoethanolamine transferase [Shewanella sp. NIFS-20-20]MBV7315682.1 phosphoethanolamine transferase [Shewanella sp. NIFS-20-20]